MLKHNLHPMGKSDAAVSLVNYVKTAFLNRWNLLAFLGGAGFAVLSGHADVLLPLVAAAEIGFLGLLASHPKFQHYVDAQAAKAARQQVGQCTSSRLRITRSLPRESLARFEALRAKCLELRQIAGELRNPGLPAEDLGLEQFQVAGLIACCGSISACSTRSSPWPASSSRPARNPSSERSASWRSVWPPCRPTSRAAPTTA